LELNLSIQNPFVEHRLSNPRTHIRARVSQPRETACLAGVRVSDETATSSAFLVASASSAAQRISAKRMELPVKQRLDEELDAPRQNPRKDRKRTTRTPCRVVKRRRAATRAARSGSQTNSFSHIVVLYLTRETSPSRALGTRRDSTQRIGATIDAIRLPPPAARS
jgi:hypothetical protein